VNSFKNLSKIKEIRSFHNHPQTPISSYLSKISEKRLLPLQLQLIHSCKSSESLDLSNFSLGPDYAEALSEGLKSLKIRNLILKRNNIKDSGLIKILSSLDFKYLSHLNISENRLTSESISQFCIYLTQSSFKLHSLNLDNCNLSDKSIQILVNSLLHFDKLREVVLSKNQIQDEGAFFLSSYLFYTETLESLDLSWNKIRGVGGKEICKSLGDNNSLKYLNLSWNSLGSPAEAACSKFLSESLARNHRLIHLELSNVRFSGNDCRVLENGLAFNSVLLGIDFEGNSGKIDAQGHVKPAGAKEKSLKSMEWPEDLEKNIKMCWICGKWNEVEFKVSESKGLVKVHLEIDDFQPFLMEKGESESFVFRMCPPGPISFFFSCDGKVFTSASYPLQSQKVEKYPEVTKVNTLEVPESFKNIWKSLCPRAMPRPRTSETLRFRLTQSSIFEGFHPDSSDFLSECLAEDLSKSNLKSLLSKDFENVSFHLKPSYSAIRETYKKLASKAWLDWNEWREVLFKFLMKAQIISEKEGKFLEDQLATFKYWNSTTVIYFTRSNFIELIVKISLNKYFKTRQIKKAYQAVKVFFRNFFDSFDKNNSFEFRSEKILNCQTEAVFMKHHRGLMKVFHRVEIFNFDEFQKSLCCISLDRKVLQKAFILSKESQITFSFFDDRLKFTEFLEAVARVVDKIRAEDSSKSFQDHLDLNLSKICFPQ
jgi:Ran GTPase-activating protein (RanGAP) involved in mRNA processing and transport